MAGGMPCQFCDGKHSADVLVTWLANGASIQVCDEDLAPALIHILATNLGADPARFYDGVKRLLDREAKKQEAEAEKGTGSDESPAGASADGELTPEGQADDGGGGQFWPGKVFGDDDSVVVP